MAAPLVSVSVTAYQHAAFLGECLDSILAQRRDFPIEVLLGEDGSTDSTRAIAKRYADAHPDLIRLFLRDRGQVVMIDGRPTGRGNFLNNYAEARGRYLCHLDGDDHWTDRDRLAIMVERMEREPDLAMCFHNAWNLYPDGRTTDYVRMYMGAGPLRDRYGVEDLATANFIPTCGVLWRIDPKPPVPEVWRTATVGDWVFNLAFAMLGPVGCVDRIMGVRRLHGGGLIGGMDAARRLEVNVRMLEIVDDMTRGIHHEAIERRKVEHCLEALDACVGARRWADARAVWRRLRRWPAYRAGTRERLRWEVVTRWPTLARAFHRMRR